MDADLSFLLSFTNDATSRRRVYNLGFESNLGCVQPKMLARLTYQDVTTLLILSIHPTLPLPVLAEYLVWAAIRPSHADELEIL